MSGEINGTRPSTSIRSLPQVQQPPAAGSTPLNTVSTHGHSAFTTRPVAFATTPPSIATPEIATRQSDESLFNPLPQRPAPSDPVFDHEMRKKKLEFEVYVSTDGKRALFTTAKAQGPRFFADAETGYADQIQRGPVHTSNSYSHMRSQDGSSVEVSNPDFSRAQLRRASNLEALAWIEQVTFEPMRMPRFTEAAVSLPDGRSVFIDTYDLDRQNPEGLRALIGTPGRMRPATFLAPARQLDSKERQIFHLLEGDLIVPRYGSGEAPTFSSAVSGTQEGTLIPSPVAKSLLRIPELTEEERAQVLPHFSQEGHPQL